MKFYSSLKTNTEKLLEKELRFQRKIISTKLSAQNYQHKIINTKSNSKKSAENCAQTPNSITTQAPGEGLLVRFGTLR